MMNKHWSWKTDLTEALSRRRQPRYPQRVRGLSGQSRKPARSGHGVRDELGYDFSPRHRGRLPAGRDKLEVVLPRRPRENRWCPRWCPVYPGADFQEREAWDLYGIRFRRPPRPAPHLDVGRLRWAPAAQRLARSLLRRRRQAL
jgi:hypothetical protein